MKRFVIGLASVALTACVSTKTAEISPRAAAPSEQQATTGPGAVALLPVLDADAGPTKNLFYSPASVEQAFSVLSLGAAGATRSQLQAVFSPLRDPMGLAAKAQGVEVRLANALWLSDDYGFRASFVSEARRQYGATAETIDVSRPDHAAARINAWAAKATEGLISQVITPQSLTPDTAAFITNALYFDGLWQTPFNGADEANFLFGDGVDRKFRLMREVLTVPLVRSDGLVAVRLPYRNPRYAMDVIIPQA